MDVREKLDFPCVTNNLNSSLPRYESETKNSASTIFQDFPFSPCTYTCKIYLIKPFLQLEKYYITLHYITHTEILLSQGVMCVILHINDLMCMLKHHMYNVTGKGHQHRNLSKLAS